MKPAIPDGGAVARGLRARARWGARGAVALLRRHTRAARLVVLVLIAVFLGTTIWQSWSQLSQRPWHAAWGLLALAYLCYVAQELSFGLIWRAILRAVGSQLGLLAAERIYLNAEVVRYIPGNVWHVLTRVVFAERVGVPRAVALASMIVELATKIAAAALVFAVTLLAWPDAHAFASGVPRGALLTVGVLGIPLLLAGLYPPLLERALGVALRVVRREPTRLGLRYRDVIAITAYWALSWCVTGVGFDLVAHALGVPLAPALALVLAIGVYALGWAIGFLSFITPSGLGIREIAIAGLAVASGLLPAFGIATVAALLARLLATGAELTCIAGVALAAGRLAPTPRQRAVPLER